MEHRWYGVCTEGSILTRQQKEWPFIRTVGCARQIRIPLERDAEGNDITPAKRSKNNLALLRKFAYNILRLAMLAEECSEIMTEAMDDLHDTPALMRRYVFSGIKSFY